jgi:hypothetical protein
MLVREVRREYVTAATPPAGSSDKYRQDGRDYLLASPDFYAPIFLAGADQDTRGRGSGPMPHQADLTDSCKIRPVPRFVDRVAG